MADASDRTDGRGPQGGGVNGSLSLAVGRTGAAEEEGEPEAARARVLACYREHGAELNRFVVGVVRDPELAGDVMQATLAKALESGHTARAETLKGWLFRVAFHEAMAQRRKARAAVDARRRWAEIASGSVEGEPDDPLIRGEAVQAVRRALGALPDEQRRVVVARVYDEKTFAEIAREAGLPLGTVLTRMRLALDKLRRALEAR